MYTYVLDIDKTGSKDADVNAARRRRVQAILKSFSDKLEEEWNDQKDDADFHVALYTSVIDAAALFQGMDREMVACELLAFFRQKRREKHPVVDEDGGWGRKWPDSPQNPHSIFVLTVFLRLSC